MRYLLLAKA